MRISAISSSMPSSASGAGRLLRLREGARLRLLLGVRRRTARGAAADPTVTQLARDHEQDDREHGQDHPEPDLRAEDEVDGPVGDRVGDLGEEAKRSRQPRRRGQERDGEAADRRRHPAGLVGPPRVEAADRGQRQGEGTPGDVVHGSSVAHRRASPQGLAPWTDPGRPLGARIVRWTAAASRTPGSPATTASPVRPSRRPWRRTSRAAARRSTRSPPCGSRGSSCRSWRCSARSRWTSGGSRTTRPATWRPCCCRAPTAGWRCWRSAGCRPSRRGTPRPDRCPSRPGPRPRRPSRTVPRRSWSTWPARLRSWSRVRTSRGWRRAGRWRGSAAAPRGSPPGE